MKLIVHTLPALVHFTALLSLPSSRPQRRNLQVLADALCVAPNGKETDPSGTSRRPGRP